jgi:hypothetical protein
MKLDVFSKPALYMAVPATVATPFVATSCSDCGAYVELYRGEPCASDNT